jgi:hypothetical protein
LTARDSASSTTSPVVRSSNIIRTISGRSRTPGRGQIRTGSALTDRAPGQGATGRIAR